MTSVMLILSHSSFFARIFGRIQQILFLANYNAYHFSVRLSFTCTGFVNFPVVQPPTAPLLCNIFTFRFRTCETLLKVLRRLSLKCNAKLCSCFKFFIFLQQHTLLPLYFYYTFNLKLTFFFHPVTEIVQLRTQKFFSLSPSIGNCGRCERRFPSDYYSALEAFSTRRMSKVLPVGGG